MNDNYSNIPDFLTDFQDEIEEKVEEAIEEQPEPAPAVVSEEPTQPVKEPEQPKERPKKNDRNPGALVMFFLDNTRLTLLAIIAVVLMGAFSLINLQIEANPEISQPIGVVQTFYPNSSPADVESNITNKIEEQVSGLSQLKEVTSNSANNFSTVSVTFESSADPKEVIDDLREAVAKVNNLPDDAETPEVFELDFNDVSIVSYSLTGPLTKLELTDFADQIIDQINDVSGVSKVELSGDVEESVKIVMDPVKMEFYNVSVSQVLQTLNATNINAPLGAINKSQDEINLRLVGKVSNIEELKTVPVSNTSEPDQFSLVTLGDIADIELSVDDTTTDSFVSDNKSEAQNAVTLDVYKQKGGNIVEISNAIEQKIDSLNQDLPEGMKIIKTNDNAFFIKNDIRTLSISGLQTIFIIFLALMIFLTSREAFVAAVAIPLIFFITFAVVYFSGQTLNGLTIFSLILSLGLIVDTSIVVVEGIHDGRKEGLSAYESAKDSLSKYKWPLIAGTATTLAAFAPMLLVSGIVGDFIKTIPVTLLITLMSSLFVSFLFTPLLARVVLRKKGRKSTIGEMKENGIERMREIYESVLESVLHSTMWKTVILVGTTIAFLASMALPITQVLKAQLFPVVDVPFVFINVEAPLGTDLETTRELIKPIEEKLSNYDSIDNYVLNLGRLLSADFQVGSATIRPNYAHIFINLKQNVKERDVSFVITKQIREELEAMDTILDISVEEISSGPPVSAPFEARITGPDLDTLEQISRDLSELIENTEGFTNVSNEFDDSPDEVQISLDQDKLSYYGISNQQVALVLQTFSVGVDAGKMEVKGEEFDINVFLSGEDTKDFSQLSSFPIETRVGNIPLSYLGEITTTKSIKSIPHIDEERSVRVTSFVDEGVLVTEVLPALQEKIDAMELPNEYRIKVGGENEDIQESFTELFSSMIVAVLLIIVILVMIFKSYRQTFIVLASLPLAIIGIFPGLAALGLPLSFPAFLGVVMLTGIVVNDAIVLLDQINNNRSEMSVKEAVVKGSRARLVPILLTSITTIFGLIPVTLSDEFWRGLGFSVIFGLLTATFLTLFIIPILYSLFYRKQA